MDIEFGKKIEVTANIAIVIMAVFFVGILLYKFALEPTSFAPPTLDNGSAFLLPDVDWAKNKKTLVLVLQKGCRFCSESTPFYRSLVEKNQDKKIEIIAVFPQTAEEGKDYLKEQGITISDVRHLDFPKEIQGTPTLVLIDDRGNVIDSWKGKLSSQDEEKVIKKLNL